MAQWLDVVDLEDTTRERYQDLIRIYIGPTFGDLAAAKLDAELLERFYARLQRCRALCNGRPATASHDVSAAQQQHSPEDPLHHPWLRLSAAVRWRHLGVNKAALAAATVAGAERAGPTHSGGSSAHAQRSMGEVTRTGACSCG